MSDQTPEDPGRAGGGPEPGEPPRSEAEALQTRIQKERQARVAKVLVILALVVLFIVFIVQNTDEVDITFVFFSVDAPLIWALLVSFVFGGVIGYLVGRPSRGVGKKRAEKGKHEGESPAP